MRVPSDECTNPTLGHMTRRDMREPRGIVRRQEAVVPGYTTKDDWGTDGTILSSFCSIPPSNPPAGDDTEHSEIPSYPIPGYWEARASFPQDGSSPSVVDLIFFDLYGVPCPWPFCPVRPLTPCSIQSHVLADLGAGYTPDMVQCYINCTFTSQDFMLPYAKLAWGGDTENCPM